MESDNHKTKARLIAELDAARQRLRELEKYSIVEKSNDGIIILQNGLIEFANAKAAELYGYSKADTYGKPFLNFIAPESRAQVAENYRKRLLGENAPETYESLLINRQGIRTPVEISASIVEYEGKTATLAIVRDISERAKFTETLKSSEEKLRTIFNNSSDGIAVYFLTGGEEPGNFIDVNDTFCEWLGYTREELQHLTPKSLTRLSRDEPPFKEIMTKIRSSGRATIERVILTKSGQEIPVEVNAHKINYQGNDMVITILRNISERKKNEASQRESEQKFKILAEKSPNMVFINQAGRIVYANGQCEEIMGYTSEELYHPDFNFMVLVAPDSTEKVQNSFKQHAAGKDVPPVEYTFITKEGRRIECILSTKIIDYEDSKAILGVVTDITERKRAEEALAFQARLLDASKDSIVVHDLDGNIVYVNDAACNVFGYSSDELTKMNIYQIADAETASLIKPRLAEVERNGRASFEVTNVRKDGTVVYREIHDSLLLLDGRKLVVGIGHDVSERKHMQSQLIMQDRLASIGQFVSGIAHELNNPLTSVVGFSELLLQKELPEDIRDDLKIISDEARRTSIIVKNLLTFARQSPQGKQPVMINDPIQTVLQIRSHEHKVNNIKVMTNFAGDLPLVKGNISQLQQVFFNLVSNAEFSVLNAHHKGTITIAGEQLKDFVRISVADDGLGIPPENMQRLFSPFFTTKQPGKGTGLGLSICQGIITEHGGRIWAESEPGKGATFFVELPACK